MNNSTNINLLAAARRPLPSSFLIQSIRAGSVARGKSLPERLAYLLCSVGVAASLWLCVGPALELLADGGPTRFVAAPLPPKAAPAVQNGSADLVQVARPTAPCL